MPNHDFLTIKEQDVTNHLTFFDPFCWLPMLCKTTPPRNHGLAGGFSLTWDHRMGAFFV